jgi:hypothetical protein
MAPQARAPIRGGDLRSLSMQDDGRENINRIHLQVYKYPLRLDVKNAKDQHWLRNRCEGLSRRILNNADEPDYTPRLGILDTGAEMNLVSEQALEDTGYEINRRDIEPLRSVGGLEIPIDLVGEVKITFHVGQHPDTIYEESFLVVSKGTHCTFDFLIGRPWIQNNRALRRNRSVLLLG